MKAIDAFPYAPEIDYEKIEARDCKKIIEVLAPFSTDQKFFINRHASSASSLKNMLNSSEQVPPEVRASYLDDMQEIERAIADILITSDNIKNDFSEEAIRDVANKNYYSEFGGTSIEKEKLQFMELKTQYNVLKLYNDKFKNSWELLKSIFGAIEISGRNHKVMQQILYYKIHPCLDIVSLTELLIRRLGFVLRITSESMKDRGWVSEGQYESSIHYSFSTVFDPDISKKLDKLNDVNNNKKNWIQSRYKLARC